MQNDCYYLKNEDIILKTTDVLPNDRILDLPPETLLQVKQIAFQLKKKVK